MKRGKEETQQDERLREKMNGQERTQEKNI